MEIKIKGIAVAAFIYMYSAMAVFFCGLAEAGMGNRNLCCSGNWFYSWNAVVVP